MADYITVEEAKTELRITDTEDDVRLAKAVTRVSRIWDALCDRYDNEFAASDKVFYYDVIAPNYAEGILDPIALGGFQIGQTPTWSAKSIYTDEFLTLNSLKTDNDGDGVFETTWAATDYLLYPLNDPRKDEIMVAPNGRYQFPVGYKTVQLSAKFGYSLVVPEPVKLGCLFLLSRFKARILSPQGLLESGEGEMTRIARMDPDVQLILESGGFLKSSKSGLHFR